MLDQSQIDLLPDNLLVDGDFEEREVHIDGKMVRPEHSQRLRNHSPDGFNWGYGGSGPAQLALAILLRFMPEVEALELYQHFKFKWVGALPRTDFEVRLNLKQIITDIVKENS